VRGKITITLWTIFSLYMKLFFKRELGFVNVPFSIKEQLHACHHRFLKLACKTGKTAEKQEKHGQLRRVPLKESPVNHFNVDWLESSLDTWHSFENFLGAYLLTTYLLMLIGYPFHVQLSIFEWMATDIRTIRNVKRERFDLAKKINIRRLRYMLWDAGVYPGLHWAGSHDKLL